MYLFKLGGLTIYITLLIIIKWNLGRFSIVSSLINKLLIFIDRKFNITIRYGQFFNDILVTLKLTDCNVTLHFDKVHDIHITNPFHLLTKVNAVNLCCKHASISMDNMEFFTKINSVNIRLKTTGSFEISVSNGLIKLRRNKQSLSVIHINLPKGIKAEFTMFEYVSVQNLFLTTHFMDSKFRTNHKIISNFGNVTITKSFSSYTIAVSNGSVTIPQSGHYRSLGTLLEVNLPKGFKANLHPNLDLKSVRDSVITIPVGQCKIPKDIFLRHNLEKFKDMYRSIVGNSTELSTHSITKDINIELKLIISSFVVETFNTNILTNSNKLIEAKNINFGVKQQFKIQDISMDNLTVIYDHTIFTNFKNMFHTDTNNNKICYRDINISIRQALVTVHLEDDLISTGNFNYFIIKPKKLNELTFDVYNHIGSFTWSFMDKNGRDIVKPLIMKEADNEFTITNGSNIVISSRIQTLQCTKAEKYNHYLDNVRRFISEYCTIDGKDQLLPVSHVTDDRLHYYLGRKRTKNSEWPFTLDVNNFQFNGADLFKNDFFKLSLKVNHDYSRNELTVMDREGNEILKLKGFKVPCKSIPDFMSSVNAVYVNYINSFVIKTVVNISKVPNFIVFVIVHFVNILKNILPSWFEELCNKYICDNVKALEFK